MNTINFHFYFFFIKLYRRMKFRKSSRIRKKKTNKIKQTVLISLSFQCAIQSFMTVIKANLQIATIRKNLTK